MRVGFIGLGNMGAAMATRLAAAGHAVRGWDLRPEAITALAERGVAAASSADDLLDAEVVVTMVPDDAAVHALWLAGGRCGRLAPSAVHVCMASIGLAMASELARRHREAGGRYVSATVFGRPFLAERGEIEIVAAGAAGDLARLRPLFDALGRRTFEVGDDPPQANLVKIARNFLVANVIESLGEAFALCGRGGVDAAKLLDVLTQTSLAAPAYRYYGGYIAERRDEVFLPLRLGLKDIELALAAAEELAVPMPLAGLIRAQMQEAIAAGWAERDWAALGLRAVERAARRHDRVGAAGPGERP